MARVFVSHASSDLDVAEMIASWLRAAGHRVFLDRDLEVGLKVGDVWVKRLFEELYQADALVAVLTAAFGQSQWCAAEVGIALANGVRLLPVRAEPGASHRLVAEDVQWTVLDSAGDKARTELVNVLQTMDGADATAWSAAPLVYPGLDAFTAGQARVFFGRDSESRQLAERLRAPARPAERGLLAVVGPSGCGKSSLVRAGLVPRLAGDRDWLVLPALVPAASPAADPVGELVRVLAGAGRHRGLAWTVSKVEEDLARPGGITRLAAELVADAAPARLPVATFLVRPLARDMLPLVITGPARHAGIGVSDELVARMVADTGSGEALPLLAYVLNQLAVGVTRGGALSPERYDTLGGVRGALSRQADAALADAAATTGRAPGDVLTGLLRLVTITDDGQPTRRRADLHSLPSHTRAEMEIFVNQRLLTIHQPGTDGHRSRPVIDIAHEQILTAWQPLADAVTSAADTLRLQADAEDAATAWDRENRPTSHLWELDRSRRAARGLNLNDLPRATQEFLTASRRYGQRRRLRITAILTVLLLLVTAGGITALIQRNQAVQRERRATARGLIPQAEQLRDRDILRALRLGLAADTLASTPETRASLEATLAATPLITNIDDDQGLTAVAFSPDGHILATGSSLREGHGGRLRLWDVSNPQTPAPLASIDDQALSVVAFSPDGHTLATISSLGGRRLRLWDVSNPRTPARLASVDDDQNVGAVAFSPDGHTLATISGLDVRRLRLWDVSNPRTPARLASIDDDNFFTSFTTVAFSPDGRTLVTGGQRGDGGRLRLWDVSNPQAPARLASVDDDQPLTAVVFSPDGHTLATSSSLSGPFPGGGGRLRLWDVSNPQAPARLASVDDDQNVGAVAFSRDGHTLATGSWYGSGGRLRLWDVSNPRSPARLASVDDQIVGAVAFSPDGHTLATGSWSGYRGGGRLRLWDIFKPPTPVPFASVDDDQSLTEVAFSRDGHTLATTSSFRAGGGGRLRLWDVSNPRTPAPLASVDDQSLTEVAFSPDGHTMATIGGPGGGRLQLWDVSNPQAPALLGSVDDDQSLTAVVFSPDGRTLATGSSLSGPFPGDGGRLRLWDVSNPQAPALLGSVDDDQIVGAVAFSRDGHTLATGNSLSNPFRGGGRLRLWDVSNPQAPARLASVDDDQSLTAVVFSPDGHTLATTGALSVRDGGGRLILRNTGWNADLHHLYEWACAAAGRGLSEEEWHSAVPEIRYEKTC
jgi:WD40 repeat protein